MRIAVMGTGGVGGYFGARLANAGHDVHFVARGRQLAALREHGLRVESPRGDLHLRDATRVIGYDIQASSSSASSCGTPRPRPPPSGRWWENTRS